MKTKIMALVVLVCVASASSVWARGNHHSGHGGYYHHSHRHHKGLGVAAGVVGGLLLGSALVSAATAPPTVVYEYPATTYRPVIRQPRICVEERIAHGEWRTSRYDGRQVWVSFSYPVTERVEVPCY